MSTLSRPCSAGRKPVGGLRPETCSFVWTQMEIEMLKNTRETLYFGFYGQRDSLGKTVIIVVLILCSGLLLLTRFIIPEWPWAVAISLVPTLSFLLFFTIGGWKPRKEEGRRVRIVSDHLDGNRFLGFWEEILGEETRKRLEEMASEILRLEKDGEFTPSLIRSRRGEFEEFFDAAKEMGIINNDGYKFYFEMAESKIRQRRTMTTNPTA